MTASIERRERQQQARGKDPLGSQPLLHIVLSKEGNSAADSVNADMLRAGLARVKAGKAKQVVASTLDLYDNWCSCACPDDHALSATSVLGSASHTSS